MIDAVNVPVQSVAANGSVLFASTRIKTGCATRHEAGSSRVILLSPGVYRVSFNGNVSIPTGGTVAQTSVAITQDASRLLAAPCCTHLLQLLSQATSPPMCWFVSTNAAQLLRSVFATLVLTQSTSRMLTS